MPFEPASATVDHAPRRGRKYFSLAEADRSLGYVGRIIEDVVRAYAQATDLRQRIEHPRPEDVSDDLRREYEHTMDRLNELVDELQLVGAELKDFEVGLLDFPAIHQGREILLCWKRGEDHITHWHEIDVGFSGRQDVALLEQK